MVTLVRALPPLALERLLGPYGLRIEWRDAQIPGSYWGEPEAGLIGDTLFVAPVTPVHSALHEASHYLCMDAARRRALHTDAGGSDREENAVCYLQILLAERLSGYAKSTMLADMDDWGYSFRLGSAAAWFESDAEDARQWLKRHPLLGIHLAAT